jgi:NAD(P)-dependent dehydrogenase (short-subunit alcohol dehydrogenase family)
MSLINSETPFDIDLGLEQTHVVVTGGCGLIGRVVVHAFLAAGACVTVIDLKGECPFDLNERNLLCCNADITNAEQVDRAFEDAENKFGPVETCIALASLDLSVLPQCESLADMDPATWQRVFDVNVGKAMDRGVRLAT